MNRTDDTCPALVEGNRQKGEAILEGPVKKYRVRLGEGVYFH